MREGGAQWGGGVGWLLNGKKEGFIMNRNHFCGQWSYLCVLSLVIALLCVSCSGGSDSSSSNTSNPPVTPNPPVTTTIYPRFAYVANRLDNTISIYTVNASTGQLHHNGYVAAGTNPRSVTVDPSGRFAYAANEGSNTISVYSINQATGALTPGTPVAAGTWPNSVTVDPSGKFAYV
jgi:hypothetical protein